MVFNQTEFNELVLSSGVVGFFNEPITLKSGRQSSWYVNWRTAAEDVFTVDGDWHGEEPCGDDCNDNNDSIYTGHVELCDGADNNCDNYIDEDCVNIYCDFDGDGEISTYNYPSILPPPSSDCSLASGTDCNDDNELINADASEICTGGEDEDCDGYFDADDPDCLTCPNPLEISDGLGNCVCDSNQCAALVDTPYGSACASFCDFYSSCDGSGNCVNDCDSDLCLAEVAGGCGTLCAIHETCDGAGTCVGCDPNNCEANALGFCTSLCSSDEYCDGGGSCLACSPTVFCDSAECMECAGESCVSRCDSNQCKVCDGSGGCYHACQDSQCEVCDGSGNCNSRCDTDSCETCNGDGMCVDACDYWSCETCDGSGACVSFCGDGQECVGAAGCYDSTAPTSFSDLTDGIDSYNRGEATIEEVLSLIYNWIN